MVFVWRYKEAAGIYAAQKNCKVDFGQHAPIPSDTTPVHLNNCEAK